MQNEHIVCLGLGSNEGDRAQLLHGAVARIQQRIGPVTAVSAFYETQPWGFASPHPFLNAAVVLRTARAPHEVLALTRQIERELGRKRKSTGQGYADRTMDIDILLYDDVVSETDCILPGEAEPVHLSLPHPLMHERDFVLRPLAEVAPGAVHPRLRRTVADLLRERERTDGKGA